MITRPFNSKVWDFETSDLWLYTKFLKILKVFGITPLEEYECAYDTSSCRFCCTTKERLRIEYVFRRLIGLDRRYLIDLDSYQNRCELYREEKYAIY